MTTNYPGGLDSFTPKTDNMDIVEAAHINDLQDAVAAVQAELGTDPAGSAATVKARLDGVDTSIMTGWVPVADVWTYASASTFTISGDRTTQLQRGTKIKMTQSSVVKYFYVIGVSYSSPNTTVTITGGADFSLANAAITNPAYSYFENPAGFPGWFSYNPTFGALGSMTFTSISDSYGKFTILGKTLVVKVGAAGTTGGTASPTLTATTPFTLGTVELIGPSMAGYVSDNVSMAGFAYIASTTTFGARRYDGVNFGLGTLRRLAIVATLELY